MRKNGLKLLFDVTFVAAILSRALAFHSILSVPYTLFYVFFIGFWGAIMLFNLKNNRLSLSLKSPIFLLFVIALYYLFFGLNNISNLNKEDALSLLSRSLVMIVFIIVACYWCCVWNYHKEIVKLSFFTMATLMVFSFLFYAKNTDLKSTLSSFWSLEDYTRTRNLFGFVSNNIAAEYSITVIILSVGFSTVAKESLNQNFLKKILIVIIDLMMVFMIIANNSRGTLITLFVVLLLLLLLRLFKKKAVKKTTIAIITVSLLAFLTIVLYCGANDLGFKDFFVLINRHHFLDNYAILQQSGRWLLGIGRISGGYFKNQNTVYGLPTNYMEMFYMNVFITSGILGSAVIAFVLLRTLYLIVFVNNNVEDSFGKWILVVYSYMLFISFFEQYLFDYAYVSFAFFSIIIYSYLSNNHKRNTRSKDSTITRGVSSVI